jgi:hypothetical protein
MTAQEMLLEGARRKFDPTKMAAFLRQSLEMAGSLKKAAQDRLDVADRIEKRGDKNQVEEPNQIRTDAKAQLDGAERLRQVALDLVCENVETTLGIPDYVRRSWDAVRQWVIDGRTEEAQGLRARFEWELVGYIDLAKQAQIMAEIPLKFGEDVPRAAEIPAAIAELSRLYDTIFTKWRTPEDLEDLVAAEYRLPMARLDAIGALHPAPSAWYEQDDDPFTLRDG